MNTKKIWIGSLIALCVVTSVNAGEMHFSEAVSYNWKGASAVGDTYYDNGELKVGKRSGLLSKKPIQGDFDILVKVKPSYGSGKNNSSDGKNTSWNENLTFGLYASRIKNNATLSKPNMDYLQFRIKSCSTLKTSDYQQNSVHGSLNKDSVSIDKAVCLIPKKYNDVRMIKENNNIKILVNDKEAIDYKGRTLESAYFGIGTNNSTPFYVDSKINVSQNTIVLDK